ncbi:hypothetical protein [Flavobacterium sp.]|jgi:hypothetical protein|uniref:hypothetical protein n=1 Tax=Flavobacterium sp. TaxID=239 RepID=UPI0037BE3DE1
MRNHFLFLIVVIFLVSCKKEDEKNATKVASDLNHFKLKGKIQSIDEKSFVFAGGTIGERKRENYSEYDYAMTFNENGQLLSEKKFLSNGMVQEENTYEGLSKKLFMYQYMNNSLFLTSKYSWDDFGNNIIITRRNPDESQYDKIVQTFVANKIVQKRTFDAQDNLTDKITYEYDAKGNLIHENYYKNRDLVTHSIAYEYDSNNNKMIETYYTGADELVSVTKFNYLNNLLINVASFPKGQELQYAETKMYDAKGNLNYNKITDNSVNTEVEEKMNFDSKKNMLSSMIYQNGMLMQSVTNKYNENNLLIETLVTKQDGTVETKTSEYEVDKAGNWISKIVYLNKEPQFKIQRTITYFD